MRELIDYWIDLRSASRSHLKVRVVPLAGAAIFMLAMVAAGGGGPVAWAGLVILGALVVYQPTTLMPTIFSLFAVASWWAGVEGPWHWALLPAALGLLLVHAGASLSSSMPPQASVPPSVVELWAWRTLLVAGLTTVAWLVAALIVGIASPRGGAVPGIVGLAVLTAALAYVAQVRRRAPQARQPQR